MSSAGSVNSGTGMATNTLAEVSVSHDVGNRYKVQIGNRTMIATVNDSNLQTGDKAKVADLLKNILTHKEINKEVSKGLSEYHIDVPFKEGSEAGSIRSKDASGKETIKDVAFEKSFLKTISNIYSDCMKSLTASLQSHGLTSGVATTFPAAVAAAAEDPKEAHATTDTKENHAARPQSLSTVDDSTDATIAALPAETDAAAADGVPEALTAAAPSKAAVAPEAHEPPAAAVAVPLNDQTDGSALPDAGRPPENAGTASADSAALPEPTAQPTTVPQPSIPSKDAAAAQKPVDAGAEKIIDESIEKVRDDSSDLSALDAGPCSLAAGIPAEADSAAVDADNNQTQSFTSSQASTPRSSMGSEIDRKGEESDAEWLAKQRASTSSTDSDASASDISIPEPLTAKPAQSSAAPQPASAAPIKDKAAIKAEMDAKVAEIKKNISEMTQIIKESMGKVKKYMSKISNDQPMNAYMALSRLRKLERQVDKLRDLNPSDTAPTEKFLMLKMQLIDKIHTTLESASENGFLTHLSFAKKEPFKKMILNDGKISLEVKNLLFKAASMPYGSSDSKEFLQNTRAFLAKVNEYMNSDPTFKNEWSQALKGDKVMSYLLRDLRKL
jgi:hypothetical protein